MKKLRLDESVKSLDQQYDWVTPIQEVPQFVQGDIVDVIGITPGQLQHFVNRGAVKLSGSGRSYGPGTRRMYSIKDVIIIAVAEQLRAIGVPIRTAGEIASSELKEGMIFENGLSDPDYLYPVGRVWAIFLDQDGEWTIVPTESNRLNDIPLPKTFVVCRVGWVIEQVLNALLIKIKNE